MIGWDDPSDEKRQWNYRVTKQWQPDLERVVWGIEVRSKEDEVVERIPDISADREFAEQAALLFEREKLEPIHLTEVVEDLLAMGRIPL